MNLKQSIIKSKLTHPAVNKNLLFRKRLLELFNFDITTKFSIITAPSGSGKTVLVSQLVEWSNKRSIWYQLDSYDNDLTTFLSYLIHNFSKINPKISKLLDILSNPSKNENDIRYYVILIVRSLEEYIFDPMILVLDDYHIINNSSIHKFLSELIDLKPDNVHIIISSRQKAPFNILRYKSHGMLNIIDSSELNFTLEEIKEYFSKPAELENEELCELKSKSDGWAAAVALSKLSLDKNNNSNLSKKIIHSKTYDEIYSFFLEEIYSDLSGSLKTFLEKTAVLEELSITICDEFLDSKDSEVQMSEIIERNLFITLLENGNYRYHSLFREFLLLQLEDKETCYKRAANLLWSKGNYLQAIDYYLLAKSHDDALAKIHEIGISLLKQGNIKTIERWLKSFPEKLLSSVPILLLLQGAVANLQTKWTNSINLLDRAIKLSEGIEKQITAKALFYKANAYRKMGNYVESLLINGRLIEIFEKNNEKNLHTIILEKVNILLWMGSLDEAVSTLMQSIRNASESGNDFLKALFLEHLGATYYATGDYYKAIDFYTQAYDIYENSREEINFYEKEHYSQRATMARIYRDWGETDKAYSLISEEIEIKEKLCLLNDLPRAYHQLALIHHDYGNKEKAVQYFEKSSKYFNLLGIEDFQSIWHEALYGKTLIDYGDVQKGVYLIEKALEKSKTSSEFNKAVCAFFASYPLLLKKNFTKALELIEASQVAGEKINSKTLISLCHMMKSNIHIVLRNDELAMHSAKECLRLSEENNYIQSFISCKNEIMPLISFAKEHKLYPRFVDKILNQYSQNGIVLNNTPSTLADDSDISSKIFIRLFDKFSIFDKAGKNISETEFKAKKAQELLAYLLLNSKKPISKDEVIEALWPEKNPKKSSDLLYTYSYKVRNSFKKLGIPESLIIRNGMYSINAENIRCDVFEFFDKTQSEDINVVEEGLKLYKGRFLNSLDNQWIINKQKNVETRYMDSLLKVSKYYLKKNNYLLSQKYLELLIDTDNFFEPAYELLLKLYLSCNNHVAAINTYKQYEKLLRSDLGISPNKKIRLLYSKALDLN